MALHTCSTLRTCATLAAAFALAGCAAFGGEREETIDLDAVPAAVRSAALAALPGLQILEAERESEDGVWTYELDGLVDDREVEIELGADGEVLDVEYADEAS